MKTFNGEYVIRMSHWDLSRVLSALEIQWYNFWVAYETYGHAEDLRWYNELGKLIDGIKKQRDEQESNV